MEVQMVSNFPDSLVTTTLGDIKITDLDIKLVLVEETQDVWVVAREAKYTGSAFPEAVGTVVRRDAWATFKTGKVATASAMGAAAEPQS